MLFGVGRVDPVPERALLQGPWYDGPGRWLCPEDSILRIEPQVGLSLMAIRTVAREAMVGEYGADIAIESRLRILRGGERRAEKNRKGGFAIA